MKNKSNKDRNVKRMNNYKLKKDNRRKGQFHFVMRWKRLGNLSQIAVINA